jgi:hypothetical protein
MWDGGLNMIILVGSKIDQSTIQVSLGKSEYSYYFLLKSFLPALELIGQVVSVGSTEEIDHLYAQYRAKGRDVVFLSFSPPQQTPMGLECPTVCIFAWEFDTLPTSAACASVEALGHWQSDPRNNWDHVFARIAGAIATSQETADLVAQCEELPVMALPAPVWGLYGQHCPEAGCPIDLGSRSVRLMGEVIDSRKLKLDPESIARRPISEAKRISLAMLQGWWHEIRLPKAGERGAETDPTGASVELQGVVYTSVLNPNDGRKNWVEMLTAFCWAFRDVEDATLVLKMTHHDIELYRGTLLNQMTRMMPFRCRVVVLHGFLDDEQYLQLIKASTFYVNASSGEGLCLPLMEFLCCGRPAVAPVHTAMADYLRPDFTFAIETSLEPDCWPHDPAGRLLTHSHRLHWQSLMESFRESYAAARDCERYREASYAARKFMKDFCAPDRIAAKLAGFLPQVLAAAADKPVSGAGVQ